MDYDQIAALSAKCLQSYMENNFPPNAYSVAKRKRILGVGINDSKYMTCVRIGVGKALCPAYSAWRDMISRVYSKKKHARQPSYQGGSICDEWLTFSNFLSWWKINYFDGYELDKDLLSNSRSYSPESCIFIPSWLNLFLNARRVNRKGALTGAFFHKRDGVYWSSCHNPITGMPEYLGSFDNQIDAHSAWVNRKLKFAFDLKRDMDAIDMRIYPAAIGIIKSRIDAI